MRILHEHGCGSAQALGELSGKALGCLLVVGTDGKLLGTFTDGDLRRTQCVQVVETSISQVMHSRPRTCSSHIKAVDAMLVGICLPL